MLFSSIPFLYYFLPIVLTLYFLVPGFLKNTVLLVSSLIFYGWGEPKYVPSPPSTVTVWPSVPERPESSGWCCRVLPA